MGHHLHQWSPPIPQAHVLEHCALLLVLQTQKSFGCDSSEAKFNVSASQHYCWTEMLLGFETSSWKNNVLLELLAAKFSIFSAWAFAFPTARLSAAQAASSCVGVSLFKASHSRVCDLCFGLTVLSEWLCFADILIIRAFLGEGDPCSLLHTMSSSAFLPTFFLDEANSSFVVPRDWPGEQQIIWKADFTFRLMVPKVLSSSRGWLLACFTRSWSRLGLLTTISNGFALALSISWQCRTLSCWWWDRLHRLWAWSLSYLPFIPSRLCAMCWTSLRVMR